MEPCKEVRRVLKGTVKTWLNDKGYGFIEPEEGGEDVFVHWSEVRGVYELREGQIDSSGACCSENDF